jgi:hypothetical protein
LLNNGKKVSIGDNTVKSKRGVNGKKSDQIQKPISAAGKDGNRDEEQEGRMSKVRGGAELI